MKILILFFAFSFLFLSCIKKETTNGNTTVGSASMKITVLKSYIDTLGISKDSVIRNAAVRVYESEDDRVNFIEMGHQLTDTGGVAQFQNLSKTHYWLRITHPTFGEKLDDESTPPNTLSLVEIVY